ncbi:hypothetical protein [Noviherbaspirillum pedocola]|uniref:Uncharacterized protein n=1 Tax=Noviherbaspirillum pedocola TaxID=2801341 RepID=A0A934SQQ1_9BURK|nr:hypothetical protein [Noviherbaspirillum pedocola]MBK4735001.1 hypothetical protein [Noviherbaspirillum pedocola]
MLSSALGERDLDQIADALNRYADRGERRHRRGNAELYRENPSREPQLLGISEALRDVQKRLARAGANVAAQGYGTRNQYGTALHVTAFGPPGNVKHIDERTPSHP